MRYLRLFSIVFLVLSLLFTGWANSIYYNSINKDRPVITNELSVLNISVNDDSKMIMDGLSASDKEDGDLTDKIMVASVSHFIEPNTVNVKYVVFDSDNNSATLTRKLHYTDYSSPQFELTKAPVFVKGDSFDLLKYVSVTDDIDGDISDHVRVITNTVSNYSVGVYPVTLEVSNSCGDISRLELWATFLEKKNTVEINLHKYLVYLEQGESFDPYQWISSVTRADNSFADKSRVTVQGNLDTKTPGYYQLNYNYANGTDVGQTCITVVVTEKES